jgi:septum site-determining protein MinD
MTASVVTITSGKGGVGKTTTTANLAVAMAEAGFKVVCIDGAIGLRNLDVVLGLENRIVYDLVDVVENRCRIRQAMIRDKRLEELYLIPAAQTRDKSAVSPSDMIRVCDELREEVDWILIDSPAGIERGFRNTIAPADMILVVTNPEVSAVRDADRIIGLVEAEEKGPIKLIINRVNPGLTKRGDMLTPADVIELLAIELIGVIPDDENVVISTNRGQPITLDPKSKTGTAFKNIAKRLRGEQVPFLNIDERGDFLSKGLASSNREVTEMAAWGRSNRQSATEAKERLKLVLIHDRTDLSQEELDTLKNELLAVISKHVEIDPQAVKISMKQEGREQKLTADIPLKPSGRRRLG